MSAPCLDLVKQMAPLDALWLIESEDYSARELDMECHRGDALTVSVLVGRHDVGSSRSHMGRN